MQPRLDGMGLPILNGGTAMIFIWNEKDINVLNKGAQDVANLRTQIKILCIDDQGFDYSELLKEHFNFNIKVSKDISDIHAVSEYPIVICDIKGIGASFNSKFEGGMVIAEIRKKYPTKQIIAFSGHTFDATYNKYFSMSDQVLSKDSDSDAWVECLDECIKNVISPIKQWKRMKKYLVDQDVSSKDILYLEQSFIDAVQKGDANILLSSSTPSKLSSDIRGVLQGICASAIFSLFSLPV